MRTQTKRLIFVLAAIVFVTIGIVALRGQDKHRTDPSRQEATPLQPMTEMQKQHSKLYRRASRKDLRKTKESTQVVFTTPFIDPDDELLPPTIEELLQHTTCQAEAIVIGNVEHKTSQFTEDGSFVFTDYNMRVQQILKEDAASPLQVNQTITFTRPGGAVTFDGKVVRVIDKSFKPLVIGNAYLLFLRRISTGAYQALNSNSSFALDGSKVRRLTAKELPYAFPYEDNAISFAERIRSTVNRCVAAQEK